MVAAAVAATAMWLVPAGVASADSHCPDGYVCVWNDSSYSEGKRTFGAGEAGRWIGFDNTKLSTKNRFGNRAVWYRGNGYWTGKYDCVNPGYNGFFPYFQSDALYIGPTGSRC